MTEKKKAILCKYFIPSWPKLQRVVFSIRSHVVSEWGLPELIFGTPAACDFIFLTVLLRMRLG